MFGCNRTAKCAAYKAIVRPTLEYAATVWNPHNSGDIQLPKIEQFDGSVGVGGIQLLTHGPLPQMTVAPNLISLLYSQSKFSFNQFST